MRLEFLQGAEHVMRIHGAYVSDTEIARLTNHLRSQQAPEYLDLREALRQDAAQLGGLEDELYPLVLMLFYEPHPNNFLQNSLK